MLVISCLSCAREELRQALTLFCFECTGQRFREQSRAIKRVNHAVRRGALPPVSEFKCSDCGAPAANYDHRDYTQPLCVEPVCAACNKARGPALDSQMRGLPQGFVSAGVGVHDADLRRAAAPQQ